MFIGVVMDNNELISKAIDICVFDYPAYEALCRKHCKSRLYDVPAEEVNDLWLKLCLLTPERAVTIINKISSYNFNNPSKQIKANYSVYSGDVTLTINGATFNYAELISALTCLRYLGLNLTKKDLP